MTTECTVASCMGFWNRTCKVLVRSFFSGQVVQLVGASSQYTMVAGLIPVHDTYKNQPVKA